MIPQRVCVVCRSLRPKAELVKLVRLKATRQLVWPEPTVVGGKGVYLCREGECGRRLFKEKKFRRLFVDAMDADSRQKVLAYFHLLEDSATYVK